MSRRLLTASLVLAALVGAREAEAVCNVAAACSAAPFLDAASGCCGATTCTLDGTHATSGAVCTLDFDGRAVVLSGRLNVGSRTVTIRAKSLRVTGVLDARGTNPNPGGNVIVQTQGGTPLAFSVDGTSGARIDLEGYVRGGSLSIQADGPVSFTSAGTVSADGIDVNADGGAILIETTDGDGAGPIVPNVTVGQRLSAQGALGGTGGSIDILSAAGLTVTDLGKILVNGGIGDAGSLSLDIDGPLALTKASLVQVNGVGASAGFGGFIEIVAGSILAEGIIEAKGGGDGTGDAGGDGGSVSLEARTGTLVLSRPNLGLTVDGATGGGEGEVTLQTHSPLDGVLTINAPISAQGFGGLLGKPAGGGSVSASAAANLEVLKNINVNGVGFSTGFIELFAARDVNVAPSNGPLTGVDPGGGGFLAIESGNDLDINGNLLMQASLDQGGRGGDILISAGNDLEVFAGRMIDVSGRTTGNGGFIGMDAGRHLTVTGSAELRANGGSAAGAPGGTVLLTAGVPDTAGDLTVHGNINAVGRSQDPARHAAIELTGCQVLLSGTANVDSRGDTAATNRLTGRTSVTVAPSGRLRTTGTNTAILLQGVAPITAGATVQPAFLVEPHPICTPQSAPPGCLMPCPPCGNGIVQFPEECEPGANPCTAGCDRRCRTRSCDDGNACTGNQCDPVLGCLNQPVAEGTSCGDATVCNGDEVCIAGICAPDAPLNCNDGNPCTGDTCHQNQGCQHALLTGVGQGGCDNRCVETCSAGTCTAITPPNCNDNNPNTNDFCNPATGQCVNTTGAACTTVAQCNDLNSCTTDSCTAGFCQNLAKTNGTPCPDTNACDGAETCTNGSCGGGTPLNCVDTDPCTTDSCDAVLGCQHQDIAGCCVNDADCGGSTACIDCVQNQCTTVPNCCLLDVDCDDGEPCTVDDCGPGNQCTHAPLPNGTSCGTTCTPGDCQSGMCNDAPLPCPDDGNPCTADFCDPASGCVHQLDPGCCTGAPGDCDDGDVCTLDTCQAAQGFCVHTPRVSNCTLCAVDTDCDVLGRCAGRACDPLGFCADVTAHDCGDGNPNTFDVCSLDGTGVPVCSHQCLNDQGCGDGIFCNGAEVCAGGTCGAGTLPSCDDGDRCTDDGCATVSDACTHTPRVEFAGVTCRLDTILDALARAGPLDVTAKLRAKIETLVGKARVGLDAARAAGPGKKALKKLRASRKAVGAIAKGIRAAQKKAKIAPPLAATLLDASQGGLVAVDALRPLLTP